MERVKGIEPSYEAWEAAVLPLNYTRNETDFTPAVEGRLNLLSKRSKPIHDLRGDESGLFADCAGVSLLSLLKLDNFVIDEVKIFWKF